MGNRGPKATAALTVVAVQFGARPNPPAALTGAPRCIWQETVKSESVGYFKTAALRAILADYCRHVDTARLLSHEIEACNPDWLRMEDGLARFDKLLGLRARETRAAADLATKLRLTNQARYTSQSAGAASRRNKGYRPPWDEGKENE